MFLLFGRAAGLKPKNLCCMLYLRHEICFMTKRKCRLGLSCKVSAGSDVFLESCLITAVSRILYSATVLKYYPQVLEVYF